MHDDFEPISAIVERLVKGLAPAGEEGTAGASRDGGGGRTAVLLKFDVSRCRPRRGAAEPAGFIDVGSLHPFVGTIALTERPATGGLGYARLREL